MTHLTETGVASLPPKILIIDDDPLFFDLIGSIAEMCGYTWQSAHNFKEALLAIKEAEEKDAPFSVVTIDVKFGMGNVEIPVGTTILQKIKADYPNLGCVIICGEVAAHEALDWRDDYGLDYCISKDRCDPNIFDRGIKRALERVKPLGSNTRRRQLLLETQERWQDICLTYRSHLARLELKKAQAGIDVSVKTENEIELYQGKLAEAESKLQEINEQLALINRQADIAHNNQPNP